MTICVNYHTKFSFLDASALIIIIIIKICFYFFLTISILNINCNALNENWFSGVRRRTTSPFLIEWMMSGNDALSTNFSPFISFTCFLPPHKMCLSINFRMMTETMTREKHKKSILQSNSYFFFDHNILAS